MSTLTPGLVLKQRYTLAAFLGTAGGSALYRAADAHTGKTVMLACVDSPGLAPARLEQLQRTLETLRQIQHPNLLNPLEAFEHAGQVVIVMEDAPGGTLHDLLQQGLLTPERARQVALDLADALSRAHRLGLTHGALTPDCIFLDEAGAPKLAGFGLAALAANALDLRYTPPEVWHNQPRDAQTDVWLLGATLYEMLASRPAFTGDTPAAVQRKVLRADYAPLPAATPTSLAAITQRMLAPKKSARYVSLRQAAVDLELGTLSGTAPQPKPHLTQPRPQPASGRRPNRLLVGLTLIFVLIAGGNLLVAYTRAEAHTRLMATQARLAAATALPSATLLPVLSFTPLPPTASPTATWTPLLPTAIPSATASPTLMLSATPATPLTSPPSPAPPLPPPATQAEGLWGTSPVTWTSPVDSMVLAFIPAGETAYTNNYDRIANSGSSQGQSFYLDAFWIDWTQVTNGQYARFRAARPDYQPLNCNANQPLFRGVKPAPSTADNYPVVNVNWYDAAAYCAWAGRRLPTVAEWDKVGGFGDSRFANHDDFCPVGSRVTPDNSCEMLPSGKISTYADYLLNPPDGYAYTAPVRNYPNRNWTGNVAEWLADWYYPGYIPISRNPLGPEIGFEHLRRARGCGWDCGGAAQQVPSPGYEPSYQSPSLGFRCAVSAAP